jgi:hypothetical protein
MPIIVSKVADIINGWIVFSRFAKKTVPGQVRIKGVPARTFEDVAKSELLELRPRPRPRSPRPRSPAEFHILRRRPPADPHILRRPREPKSDLDSLSKYLSSYLVHIHKGRLFSGIGKAGRTDCDASGRPFVF